MLSLRRHRVKTCAVLFCFADDLGFGFECKYDPSEKFYTDGVISPREYRDFELAEFRLAGVHFFLPGVDIKEKVHYTHCESRGSVEITNDDILMFLKWGVKSEESADVEEKGNGEFVHVFVFW